MHRIIDRGGALLAGGLIAMAALAACGDDSTEASSAQGACLPGGSLSVAIRGRIRADLGWEPPALECSGMPRPDGAGARLRFSGSFDDSDRERRLAFIIALPELVRGATADETPAVVTLMEENSGRFFSSAEAPVCWSDVVEQAPIAGDEYAIRGVVYCVSPLAELNGSGGVAFTELNYSGRIDWGAT